MNRSQMPEAELSEKDATQSAKRAFYESLALFTLTVVVVRTCEWAII